MQSKNDLEKLLKSCLNYPSGDNCQPFQFNILSSTSFEIYHDSEKSKHRLNFLHSASLISFGSLIETISLQALSINQKIDIDYSVADFSKMTGRQLWAKISISRTTQEITNSEPLLWKHLANRCVDRRPYGSAPVPSNLIQWLTKEAQKNSNLSFGFSRELSPELTTVLMKNEEVAWKDIFLVKDILKWIRFNKKVAQQTKDGMTWKSLQLKSFQKPFMKLFSIFPRIYYFIAQLGATKANSDILKQQFKNSGGFGWLALSTSDPIQIIDSGRTFFRMWVYLNSQGYGFQPIALATLPTHQFHFQKLPDNWSTKLKKMYPKVAALIQKDFHIPPEFIPIIGFRTGQTTPLQQEAYCLRKPLHEVQYRPSA